MKGFLSSVAVGFAVAVLAFAFAASTVQQSEARASTLAFESQAVHQRALDARALADAAFKDALIDAGYASNPCAPWTSNGFCGNLTHSFSSYLNESAEALNNSVYSVRFEPSVSCNSLEADGGYASSYFASFELSARVNSSKAAEPIFVSNASFVDVNMTKEGAFQLRLRYPSGAVLHSFSFSCN